MNDILLGILLIIFLFAAAFLGARSAIERMNIPSLIHTGISEAFNDYEDVNLNELHAK